MTDTILGDELKMKESWSIYPYFLKKKRTKQITKYCH